MKISQKELLKVISEEIKLSIEEGDIDEGWLDDLKAKAKSGWDIMTGKGRDLEPISPDKQATDVSDKQVDIETGLEKEKGEADSAMRAAKDELLDVVKFAEKSQREMQAKITDFVSEMDPKNESDVEFMKGAEAFTRTLETVAAEYETFFGVFSRLVKQQDSESDHADFKADATASAKTRAGMGLRTQQRAKGAAHMFESNNKNAQRLRKAVKEELYNLLVKKIK